MKYSKIFILVPLFIAGLFFVSCEDDSDNFNKTYSGDSFFRFPGTSSSIAENAPEPAAIPVTYTNTDGAGGTGSVSFEVTGGTAGEDYTVVNAQNSLTFNAANGFSDTIWIQPVDNTTDEPEDLELTVSLSNPSNGIIGWPGPDNSGSQEFKLRINDDDCTVIPIGGEYTSVARGTSTDGCCPDETTGFMAEITITDLGGGSYMLNDFSGGIYLDWYAVYGLTSQDDSPATFTLTDPVNGTIVFDAGQTEPFGESVSGTGTWNQCTGEISYHWDNGWGDEGDVVLTPK